ncbi:MAG: isopentenyl-diphosphate Delta-isomerase [Candidatus Gottesmanbacteria bacterium]|nr:isopentenyl-diphosphate Delta-isomerase [Candidatus Gottesmanbacteria bacterium]
MEFVVLVDEYNNEIGTAPKDTVHSDHTPLHRAFSLFIFNSKNKLLVTRRAATKKTFPDVWTNTVCGHPASGEDAADAAKRRLKDELGIISHDIKVQEVSPYQYRFADKNGIVENEICPILVAFHDGDPIPNLQEVGKWKWMPWREFLAEIQNIPGKYSPWCVEEAKILFDRKLVP